MTDILGNSLNDRLLFAVPKSTFFFIQTPSPLGHTLRYPAEPNTVADDLSLPRR